MVTERDTPARQCTRTPFSLLRASSVGRTQELKPTKINTENHIICTFSYSRQYYKDVHNLNTRHKYDLHLPNSTIPKYKKDSCIHMQQSYIYNCKFIPLPLCY